MSKMYGDTNLKYDEGYGIGTRYSSGYSDDTGHGCGHGFGGGGYDNTGGRSGIIESDGSSGAGALQGYGYGDGNGLVECYCTGEPWCLPNNEE